MKLKTLNFINTIIFTALFFSVNSNIDAQIAFRLGVNLAGRNYDPDLKDLRVKRIFGIGAGIFYTFKISKYFSIQYEMNFIQHGVRIVNAADNALFRSERGGYIQIPFLAKYGTTKKKGTNFYLQAGPYIGIGLWYLKGKFCLGNSCEEYRERFGDSNAPDKLDFGLHLGGGLNFNKRYSVDARYILGLKHTGDGGGIYTIKNNGIFLSVGYTLKS